MTNPENPVCGICREEKTKFETRCGHNFHRKCLQAWLNKQNTCPYCRTEISSSKKLEHFLRNYKGEEEMLKKMNRADLIEVLCYFCTKKLNNFGPIIEALKKFNWGLDNQLNGDIGSILCMACEHENIRMVSYLLEIGAKVNKCDPIAFGYPINYAAEKGNLELLNLLIEKGADLNARGLLGTALMSACIKGRTAAIERLLQFDLDVNIRGYDNYTALHIISMNHMCIIRGDTESILYNRSSEADRISIAKMIITKGADINLRNYRNQTPLFCAIFDEFPGLVKLFLENGADVDSSLENNSTALICASKRGNLEIAKLLVEHGASINAAGTDKFTPLHFASHLGNLEMVKLFIENGSDLNAQTRIGLTPLHLALKEGHYEVALALVESGCKIDLKTNYRETALHVLCKFSSNKNRKLQKKLLIMFLKAGCDPNEIGGPEAETPLSLLSLSYPKASFASILVKYGANVNWMCRRGRTALHRAVVDGNPDLVKELIELGASVNAIDAKGRQPIHHVLIGLRCRLYKFDYNKFYAIMEALKLAGADLNAQTGRGTTAFHYIKNDKELGILKKFVELGADVSKCDHKGRDLRFRVKKRKLFEIFSWLEELKFENKLKEFF